MEENRTSQNSGPNMAGAGFGAPPSSPQNNTPFEPASQDLIDEIRSFLADCWKRYEFNNAWDVFLTVLGISLSIAVVVAGFVKRPFFSAILCAIVASVVTAQKAFPFGQRANFYRLLIGQSQNLITRASQGLLRKQEVVNTLSSLRMDFAQQLPRGSSSNQPSIAPPAKPGAETGPDKPQARRPQEPDPASASKGAPDDALNKDPKGVNAAPPDSQTN
jgi:hypothetical protein